LRLKTYDKTKHDMDPLIVGYIGLAALFVLIILGMRIAYATALVGIIGILFLKGWSVASAVSGFLPHASVAHYSLSVIPLFVIMGYFAYHANLTSDAFNTARQWVGHFPGGLALATTFGCAAFAACTGASIAAASVMGKIAIPEMRKYSYNTTLAAGAVAAGGTLAVLIPPSVPLVIFGVITEKSIGVLLLAGIIPGILTALIFSSMVYIRVKLNPDLAPPLPSASFKDKLISLKNIWGIIVLVCLIIGGIYTGIFTPTEAGGAGATGAFLMALMMRRLSWAKLKESLLETGRVTIMIFSIIVGVLILVRFLALTGVSTALAEAVLSLHVHRIVILIGVLLIYLVLGMFLEIIGMLMLTVPIIFPAIVALGFDPIWFGIIVVKMCEMCLMTPPVGLNVYAVKSVAPDIPLEEIFKGIFPFLLVDVLTMTLLIAFPKIVTFLPSIMIHT